MVPYLHWESWNPTFRDCDDLSAGIRCLLEIFDCFVDCRLEIKLKSIKHHNALQARLKLCYCHLTIQWHGHLGEVRVMKRCPLMMNG
jgi:hypothetical protein